MLCDSDHDSNGCCRRWIVTITKRCAVSSGFKDFQQSSGFLRDLWNLKSEY